MSIGILVAIYSPAVPAAGRFITPVLIGDSWSNSHWDWPGSTAEIAFPEYRNHAISGEWLSARDIENKQGMVLNVADYLDLTPDADALIVQGGGNDIYNSVDAETLKAALQSIVAEAKSRSNIRDILVISPGPFGGVPEGWTQAKQDQLEEYINWLPGYTQAEQIDLYIVYDDVNHPDYPWIISDGTNGAPDYTDDGAHLDLLGAEVMALGVDERIREIRSRPEQVQIDIDPWDDLNEVRPNDSYLLTVGVITTSVTEGDAVDFDPLQVDPASLRFGLSEAQNVVVQPLVQDIDGDSTNDRVFGFRMEETGIQCDDTTATLVGETYSGDAFIGSDAIAPAGCSETGCHP